MIKIGDNYITLKVGSDDVSAAYLGNTLVYSGGTPPTPPVPPHDYSQDFLTFVAKENGTFTFSRNSINYSIDNGSTWTTLAANTASPTITSGSKILWKATLTPFASGIGTFSSTGQFDVEGNPMSLLYGDNFIGETDLAGENNAFYRLFYNCSELINSENLSLPATTLASNCYQQMFAGCTGLTTAPSILPATILATQCYYSMFNGCTLLTTAPELPATTLVNRCYMWMFQDCASLTTSPELSATTLATNCYYGMFNGCTSLNYIKCLATDISASGCTYNWVSNVAANGTFVKAANMTGWPTGDNGIPINWTVVDDTPKWVATYTGGIITSAECNSDTSITVNEITKANLESVVIGNCVSAIVGECFSDCSKLSAATINGYTSIDDYSFARNNGTLKTIIMLSPTPPPCANTAFTYYNHGYVPMTSITIYVPAASVEAYKAASGWSRYADKIQAITNP